MGLNADGDDQYWLTPDPPDFSGETPDPDTLDALEGLWAAEGDLPEQEAGVAPVCPNPTRWRLMGSRAFSTNMQRVSPVVSAAAAPVTAIFTIARTLTYTWGVTAGVKAGIGIIEAETGISLQTTVRIQAGMSYRFTVPAGKRMALFAGCYYLERTFRRTVYSSAGPCYPVVKETVVSSPASSVIEVRKA